MNPQQYIGRATVRVDGQEIKMKPGVKCKVAGVQRNTVKHMNGGGFAEEIMEGTIEGQRIFDGSSDLVADSQLDNVTVDFVADTGQHYIFSNAWMENLPEVTAENGGGDTYTFHSFNVTKGS